MSDTIINYPDIPFKYPLAKHLFKMAFEKNFNFQSFTDTLTSFMETSPKDKTFYIDLTHVLLVAAHMNNKSMGWALYLFIPEGIEQLINSTTSIEDSVLKNFYLNIIAQLEKGYLAQENQLLDKEKAKPSIL